MYKEGAMENLGGKGKVFSKVTDEDLLIEAFAPVKGQDDSWRRVAFHASLIAYLVEFDEKISGMVLHSGVTIPAALPFSELKKQIYDQDFRTGSSIDLTLVTGKTVSAVQKIRLSDEFNPAAKEDVLPTESKDVEIRLIAHAKATDREFFCATFKESHIQYFEPHANRKETETFIKLKNGRSVNGVEEFYVSIPMSGFTNVLAYAKKERRSSIDITETTRPKSDKSYTM